MNVFDSIAERRIKAAREAGLFDDLPGHGKPLPDLHRERPPGWWAARVAKQERHKMLAEELDYHVASAMAPLWRSDTEDEVRLTVAELNQRIDDYNRVTTWHPRTPLNVEDAVSRWRRYRS